MKTTREQIMEELKLEDWDSFKKKQEEKNKEKDHLYSQEWALRNRARQTGRTTRTMVSALVVASRGLTVTIIGPRGASQEYLLSRLQELADLVGLKRNSVVKKGADVEFYDHLYWEMDLL